jgi:hypothetical protein
MISLFIGISKSLFCGPAFHGKINTFRLRAEITSVSEHNLVLFR